MTDQALSSASNMFVVFAVARVSSVDAFGAISLALAALTTALAVGRGLLGTPITLLSADQRGLKSETRHALMAASCAGLPAAGAIALIAVLTGAPAGTFFLALAAPVVLVQDVGRFFCISAARPRWAVVSDGVWALGSAGLLFLTLVSPKSIGSGMLLASWAGLAVFALLIILIPMRLVPCPRGVSQWWRTTLHDRLRYGAEAVVGATSSFIVLGVATAIIGVAATAALRGAGAVLGPLSVLMSTIPLAVVPELRRQGSLEALDIWRPLRKIAVPMSALAVVVGVGALLVPATWGELLLGDSWNVVRPLLPITGTEYAALAWLSSATGGLRAQGRSGALLVVGLEFAGASIILGALAAIVFHSVVVVAVALALAGILAAVVAKFMLFRGKGSGADIVRTD